MNCRRIQSVLSAYMDAELTGEEMIAVRHHLSVCEFCQEEYESLHVVKKLLGSLDVVEATTAWSSKITVQAYSGGRPWWEKTISNEWLSIQLVRPLGTAQLSPRGTRMARALALSAVFVFLAAVPIRIEHMADGVTGTIAPSMVPSMFPFNLNQKTRQRASSVFPPVDPTRFAFGGGGTPTTLQRLDAESMFPMSTFLSPASPSSNNLTMASTSQK